MAAAACGSLDDETSLTPTSTSLSQLPGAYRVLTYNTQLRPAVTNDAVIYAMANETRAGLIAARILTLPEADAPDIVALQEVFDDGARARLVDDLKGSYPYIVTTFDNAATPQQDSGLMVASKFPFVRTAIPPGRESDCGYASDSTNTCLQAAHQYEHRSGADALSNKGIAYVRIDNPRTGRLLNLFYTHTQADPQEAGASAAEIAEARANRAAQIEEAKDFISAWAPASVTSMDTMLVGDLNIVGAPATVNTFEYESLIAGSDGLAGIGLVDTYRAAVVPDYFLSFDAARNTANSKASGRLDYVLLRTGAGTPACAYQLELMRELHVESAPGQSYVSTDLSDHYPVRAVIGAAATQCSPDRARVFDSATPVNETLSQRIERPGAFQWFTFMRPGTYSIEVSNAGANLEVDAYRASDLSHEIPVFAGDRLLVSPADGIVLAVDKPTTIRLRASDPLWASTYTLRVREHLGASRLDAIVLSPFVTRRERTPSPASTFYVMEQPELDTGARQRLKFETSNHATAKLQLTVLRADGQPIPGLATASAFSSRTLTTSPSTSPINGRRQKLYLRVDRTPCASGCDGTYDVHWETNYRQLDIQEITYSYPHDGWSNAVQPRIDVTIDDLTTSSFALGFLYANNSLVVPPTATTKNLPHQLRSIGYTATARVRLNTLAQQTIVPSTNPPATTDPTKTMLTFQLTPDDTLRVLATQLSTGYEMSPGTTTLSAPIGIRCTLPEPQRLRCTWEDNSFGATGYSTRLIDTATNQTLESRDLAYTAVAEHEVTFANYYGTYRFEVRTKRGTTLSAASTFTGRIDEPPPTTCGNGRIDSGEVCDGDVTQQSHCGGTCTDGVLVRDCTSCREVIEECYCYDTP